MASSPKRLRGIFSPVLAELPRMGTAGSRSALLHSDAIKPERDHASFSQLRALFIIRWAGTLGALLIALGGLGAGALPVVGAPLGGALGAIMSRMLVSSSALVFIGVGLVVVAWLLLAPAAGIFGKHPTVSTSVLWRTFATWALPLLATAPLFTQDIYSYLANGAIVATGLDPYSAGPVELLGPQDPLARSVPFIWANSPSPYGPVALGIAALISQATDNAIGAGIFAHRLVSLLGLSAAGIAMMRLARRCHSSPETALWLGLLNPLTLLHLIGGIHNEAIMLGLLLIGLELGLSATDRIGHRPHWPWIWRLALSGLLISCAGMVKVTGFIGLGFVGMAVARCWWLRWGWPQRRAIILATGLQAAVLVAAVASVAALSGIGLGWISGQGGAAQVLSWMSMSTAVGIAAGFGGQLLGLGDHSQAMLVVTRTVGVLIAAAFMVRMLFATFRGSIHPVGGLGVATLVLVLLFPVVHPWYLLWAVMPLAAWANRRLFRWSVLGYSAIMSFTVLPRGLGLPPDTIAAIYGWSVLGLSILLSAWWVLLRRAQVNLLH